MAVAALDLAAFAPVLALVTEAWCCEDACPGAAARLARPVQGKRCTVAVDGAMDSSRGLSHHACVGHGDGPLALVHAETLMHCRALAALAVATFPPHIGPDHKAVMADCTKLGLWSIPIKLVDARHWQRLGSYLGHRVMQSWQQVPAALLSSCRLCQPHKVASVQQMCHKAS